MFKFYGPEWAEFDWNIGAKQHISKTLGNLLSERQTMTRWDSSERQVRHSTPRAGL